MKSIVHICENREVKQALKIALVIEGTSMSEKSLQAGLERRKEDYGLITGEAHFVDDLRPAKGRPRTLYMAVVRSPYAHAVIEHIQLDAALALPGVVTAFDGSELVNSMRTLDVVPVPNLKKTERRPLPAVTDPEAALAPGAPLLYEEFGSNVAFSTQSGGGDFSSAFEHADHIIHLRVVNQRLAPSSIETRGSMF